MRFLMSNWFYKLLFSCGHWGLWIKSVFIAEGTNSYVVLKGEKYEFCEFISEQKIHIELFSETKIRDNKAVVKADCAAKRVEKYLFDKYEVF